MDNGVKATIYSAFAREKDRDDLTSSFFGSDISMSAEFYS